MLRAYPQTVAELTWFFEQASSEVGPLKSTWPAEVRAAAERAGARDDRPHLVHVPSSQPSCTAPEPNWHAITAAGRERRIMAALQAADVAVQHEPPPWPPLNWSCPAPPSHVLRLRFRELLQPCRIPFGMAGQAGRRGRPISGAIGIRLNPVRGAGNLAHLTPAAIDAHRAALSRRLLPQYGVIPRGRERSVSTWTDQLGIRLGPDGACTAAERELGKRIALECEVLEAQAIARYRAAIVRVPERVRRAARDRDAA